MTQVYAPWMLEEDVFVLREILLGRDPFVLKACGICKGFYPVPSYVDNLLCCAECAVLSDLIQKDGGDSSGLCVEGEIS